MIRVVCSFRSCTIWRRVPKNIPELLRAGSTAGQVNRSSLEGDRFVHGRAKLRCRVHCVPLGCQMRISTVYLERPLHLLSFKRVAPPIRSEWEAYIHTGGPLQIRRGRGRILWDEATLEHSPNEERSYRSADFVSCSFFRYCFPVT